MTPGEMEIVYGNSIECFIAGHLAGILVGLIFVKGPMNYLFSPGE